MPTTVAFKLAAVACVTAKLVLLIEPEMLAVTVPLTGWVTPDPSTKSLVAVTVRLEGIFVLIADRVVSVAAPVGKLIVPEMLVMFHVPDCVAATVPLTGCVAGKLDTATVPSTVILPPSSLTGIEDWLDATTTGAELAIVA